MRRRLPAPLSAPARCRRRPLGLFFSPFVALFFSSLFSLIGKQKERRFIPPSKGEKEKGEKKTLVANAFLARPTRASRAPNCLDVRVKAETTKKKATIAITAAPSFIVRKKKGFENRVRTRNRSPRALVRREKRAHQERDRATRVGARDLCQEKKKRLMSSHHARIVDFWKKKKSPVHSQHFTGTARTAPPSGVGPFFFHQTTAGFLSVFFLGQKKEGRHGRWWQRPTVIGLSVKGLCGAICGK